MTRLQAITEQNRKWWTLGAMCFALFMIMLDNTVVNVALPSIQRGPERVALRGSSGRERYTLTFAVLLVTGGRLGDIFGRRRRSSPAWCSSRSRRYGRLRSQRHAHWSSAGRSRESGQR